MSKPIVMCVFRALLRQARLLDHSGSLIKPLPQDAQWGTHRFITAYAQASKAQLLSDLLPGLASVIDSAAAQASPAGATRAAAAAARAPTAAGRMKAEDLHASLLPAAVTQQAEAPASDLDPETRPAAASGVDASSQASSSSSSSSVGEPSLRQLVSAAFRSQRQATAAQQQVLIDQAFQALRLALEQQYLSRCSCSKTTEGVKVDVSSRFEQVAVGFRGEKAHVFTYRVRISNLRQEPVKVLGRSWTIKNDSGQVRVHIPLDPGNAVVGQQPLLMPGHGFEYYSGTDLDTPAGLQSGSLLVDVYGQGKSRPPTERITVEVAPFPLLHPHALKQGAA